MYAYVRNSPENFIDSTGLIIWCPDGASPDQCANIAIQDAVKQSKNAKDRRERCGIICECDKSGSPRYYYTMVIGMNAKEAQAYFTQHPEQLVSAYKANQMQGGCTPENGGPCRPGDTKVRIYTDHPKPSLLDLPYVGADKQDKDAANARNIDIDVGGANIPTYQYHDDTGQQTIVTPFK